VNIETSARSKDMADTTTTIVGNLTRAPELRTTPSGKFVCNFSVAVNRLISKPGEEKVEDTSYFDITAWDSLATNVADLPMGARVLVTGRLQQRTWEQENPVEGEAPIKRSKVEITAEEVGASLRWASVDITKNAKRSVDEAPAPVGGEEF
jgi:single-strand DNA-binding protein